MTKEEMLVNNDFDIYSSIQGRMDILNSMEEYANQEILAALKFAQFQTTRNPERLYKMYLESKEK